MDVTEAVATRKTIRAFLDKPIADKDIRSLLAKSARAPSGGNVQPWRVYVVNNQAMTRFKQFVGEQTAKEEPAYQIYPQGLTEPYRSAKFKVGEDMYALLGIPRDDKGARVRRLMENYRCFGAPAVIFCFIDRQMGAPQWSDLGMFLQTFMLLATEAGIATCAQEAWAARPQTVTRFVHAPEELMLFCGISLGYADTSAPVNTLVSDREPLDKFVTFCI